MKQAGKNGFSLIEMTLSIALLSILTALSLPLYRSFQLKNDVDTAEAVLSQSIRRAQALAQSGIQDGPWGVFIQSGEVVLFQGTDYASRDTDFDEPFVISDVIQFTGLSEIVFSQVTGLPSQSGTITMTSETNVQETLTINEKGFLE